LKILLEAGCIAAFAGLTPNDGATPLLVQVGSALATIDPMPVLLIDADSHNSKLYKLMDVPQSPGFVDCLKYSNFLDTAIRSTTLPNLSFLPLGEQDSNLSMRLSTPEAKDLFGLLRERYRYILIDAGVILKTSEGMLISAISDGVVIAMAAGKRRLHEVRECREGLERLKVRLLGIVLTRNLPRK
jgi:tyrosine-protein kinase Etk/Wzc